MSWQDYVYIDFLGVIPGIFCGLAVSPSQVCRIKEVGLYEKYINVMNIFVLNTKNKTSFQFK